MRLKPAAAGCTLVNPERVPDVDSKFVLAQSRGDVRMRVGKDVGVDAQSKARASFELTGARGQQSQLSLALYVELENARGQRAVDLGRRLSHARVDHPLRSLRGGRQHPFQLAAGNNVESGSAVRQQLEDGQRGVGLDGVTHQVIPARESLLKQPQALYDLICGIHVERGAESSRQGFQGDFAAVECAQWLGIVKGTGRCNRGFSQVEASREDMRFSEPIVFHFASSWRERLWCQLGFAPPQPICQQRRYFLRLLIGRKVPGIG